MARGMQIKGFANLKGKMIKLGEDLPIAAITAMQKKAREVEKRSNANIKTVDLVNFGDLLDSSYVGKPTKIPIGWKVEVGYRSQHAAYQHEGWDGQSMPPLENLEEWVTTKLGIPYPEATWVAYAISLKLMNDGHDAEPFLQEAIDGVRAGIPRDVNKLIQRWMKRRYGKGPVKR